MLPQLLFFAAIIVTSWFLFRWVRQEIARVDREMAKLDRMLTRTHNRRTARLEFNPATGHYHPIDIAA